MDFKGTKGKWEFLNTELADFHLTTVICEKEVIAHISSEKSNRVANALLISKALEILELLEEMYDEWCETGIGENKLSDYMLKTKQLIKEATEL